RVPRLRGPAGEEDHVLELRAPLERNLAAEIARDQLARLAIRDHQAAPVLEQRRQTGIRLPFVPAAEQQHERSIHRFHRDHGGGDVRRLRVVDPVNAADVAHRLEPVRQWAKRAQPFRDDGRGHTRPPHRERGGERIRDVMVAQEPELRARQQRVVAELEATRRSIVPAVPRRCTTSAVVVVLPFVPVIAIQRVPDPASAPNPRSISDKMGTRAARAAASGGASGGTPGETITAAAPRICARSWRPTSTATPRSERSASRASPPYGWSDASLAYTRTPSRASSRVAATPLFPSPIAANTPPAMSSRNSALSMIATVPSAPPMAREPVSPMNTWAGCALNHRNPSAAPARAPQKIVSSWEPGRKYTPR